MRALGSTRGFYLERRPIFEAVSQHTREDLMKVGLYLGIEPQSVAIVDVMETDKLIGGHRFRGGKVSIQKMARRALERTAPMSGEPLNNLAVKGVELAPHDNRPARGLFILLGQPGPLVDQRQKSIQAIESVTRCEPKTGVPDNYEFVIKIGSVDDPSFELNDDITELLNPGSVLLEPTNIFPHLEDLAKIKG